VFRRTRLAWLFPLLASLCLAFLARAASAQEGGPPAGMFTVIVSSAYARSQPDVTSERLFSVFAGES
jgi:hypothetical protein